MLDQSVCQSGRWVTTINMDASARRAVACSSSSLVVGSIQRASSTTSSSGEVLAASRQRSMSARSVRALSSCGDSSSRG